MSKRLMEMVNAEVLRLGRNGDAKLALKADVSLSTVRNAKLRGHVSKASGYHLALACGRSEEEALDLSKECSPEARETA